MVTRVNFDLIRQTFVNYRFADDSGNCIAAVRAGYQNEDRGTDGSLPENLDLVLIGAIASDPEHGDVTAPRSEQGAHLPGTWVPIKVHA